MSMLKRCPGDPLLNSRVLLLGILDIIVINCAAFLALLIRFEFDLAAMISSGFVLTMLQWSWANTLLTLAVFVVFRLYRSLWGFAGADELLHIFAATILVGAIELAVVWMG